MNILIVDDEAAIRDMVRLALEMEGFTIFDASNTHQASKVLEQEEINLILLDWMLPGLSGVDYAARLRRENLVPNTGIIMLTAKGAEQDIIRGLESGADDYVSKPFSTAELISRINAVVRRIDSSSSLSSDSITAAEITVDNIQHKVFVSGASVSLSPTEYRLLHFFVANQNRVFDRDQLLDRVWGERTYVEDRTVDVHIRRLRKILQEFSCDHYIQTVRGVGYRFSLKP